MCPKAGQGSICRASQENISEGQCCSSEENITERYKFDSEPFAKGGFAKVFFARKRLEPEGPPVVVKVVQLVSRKVETKFEKELAIMRRLEHPNICALSDFYQTEATGFFVMESCEGGELFDRIVSGGRLPECKAAAVIKQVALAVEHAHSRGIVHRDLKPENVCFCTRDPSDMRVKLIDWGIASIGSLGGMTSVVGSPDYIAPEVMEATRNRPYTSACDAWSLGVLTYVVVSALHPFSGSNSSRLSKMKSRRYSTKGSAWKRVSNHAQNFIRDLLHPTPKSRLSIEDALTHPFFWMSVDSSDETPRLLGRKHRGVPSARKYEAMDGRQGECSFRSDLDWLAGLLTPLASMCSCLPAPQER